MSNHKRRLGADFEREMVSSSSASATRSGDKGRATKRDLDRNFGGDAQKAAICEAVDRGLPTTRVFINQMAPEVQEAYNEQRFGYASFKGLLISAARLVESGELKAAGSADSEGRVPVNVDLSTLEKLVKMVVAHRESLPVSREDALEELGRASRSIEFLKGHNNGVDFSESNGLLSQARSEFKELAFSPNVDFRPVVRLLVEAVTAANDAVNSSLVDRNRRTAATIGEEDRIEAEIQKALAMKNPGDVRNALIEQFKVLRGMGATDPEWKPRDNGGYRQGTGNRPDRNDGRRRDAYPRGMRQQPRFGR